MLKIIIAAIVVTIVGLFILTKIDPAQNTISYVEISSEAGSGEDDTVKVDITGQILHPGGYYIAPEKTLGNLIEMAGGTLENADPDSYTPGLVIGNRTSFYIGKLEDIPSTCTATKIVKVNVNTAGESELTSVKFSSSQATALVSYRTDNGNFQALEDIMKVSGIGEKTFLTVRDYICLS
ncbi:MAG: helix-hairpin-helix domain-containing protein [Bacilli bacterium]|jgi:competence protein ComEA|nr:helix-hairpin-helix domain-containing protein [Bacilli bacterium]